MRIFHEAVKKKLHQNQERLNIRGQCWSPEESASKMVEPHVFVKQVGRREWSEVEEVFGAQQVSHMYWQVAAWGFCRR